MNTKSKGMTLVEILVISGLLVLIVGKLIDIGTQGSKIMDETSKLIRLQNGVRAVLENMVQDVNATVAFLSPRNKQLTLARYLGPVDSDLLLLNMSSTNPAFPYYMEGVQTTIKQNVLFVEYQFHDPETGEVGIEFLANKPGGISRIAKKGVLDALDSPEGTPYFIDQYSVNKAALTLESKKVLAEKVKVFNLEYYGYEDETGALVSLGELGTDPSVSARVAMVAVHIVAEDPYAQPNRRTPVMEIHTKIFSFRHIQENKYPEYFGHTDRDLRF
jgi:hypothetical protein